MKNDTLSIAESAALKGKAIETIYRLVRSRRIEADKDEDGNWKIPRRALLDYYAAKESKELVSA
jgi:hypothetical protein